VNAPRRQSSLLTQLEGVSARELQVRECLLRLRAVGQRAQYIDRASPQAWTGVIAERQELIDRLGALGWPPAPEGEVSILVAAAGAADAGVRDASARARKTAAANITLLAEIVGLDARIERRLAQQMSDLAEELARPIRSRRVQVAYTPYQGGQPRFLDRRK
jgi:hypothetical protein